MPEIVSVPHHPSGMGDLFPRQLAGTAEMWPTPPGRLHPSLRALGNQGALKCGAGSHDMKHQLAPGRGRVDRFRERLEAHPLHPQGMHQTHQVRHRATEPIQPPDHQHIAWGERRQRGIQPGTLHLRTREPRVVENPRAAGRGEGVQLEVELLVVRGHACIPDVHTQPRPSCAFGPPHLLQQPFVTYMRAQNQGVPLPHFCVAKGVPLVTALEAAARCGVREDLTAAKRCGKRAGDSSEQHPA